MLFGKKKKDKPQKNPATIKEAIEAEAAEESAQVEITQAEVSGSDETGTDNTGGDDAVAEDRDTLGEDTAGEDAAASAPAIKPGPGPRDAKDLESTKGYLDFGALLIPAAKGQKIRMDIDQKTKRVVSLTITIAEASIQVQAFSAPKSGGIWSDVREQIMDSVTKQKGRTRIFEGRFGKEVHARVPTVLKDGRQGWRAARFIGFEGNRWFLRGVVGGKGAVSIKASAGVEELFSRIVVVRGDDPLPPRELLKLRPPAGAKRVIVPKNSSNGVPSAAQGGQSAPETGNNA